MTHETIALEQTGHFAPIFLDYLKQRPQLKPYYSYFPTLDNFKQAIADKQFSQANRHIIADVLKSQYATTQGGDQAMAQIEKLQESNTYTVTTGHQLNIFTGPLYFIYKIVSTINLAKQLKSQYPDQNFVPIYWMASEDHDFEEISHFLLFGKKYQWETSQTGAVGRMNPQELSAILEEMPEKPAIFEKAYLGQKTLAAAVRQYVHDLFGAEGLVVIDADDSRLKKIFAPIIKDDLIANKANELVESTTQSLADLGYKSQIFPREINFFYLKDHFRERIVKEGNHFEVLNQGIQFTEEELLAELEQYPERFSPNVVMRPLYQESILPNIAYLGGPAEVAYWMQLKGVFAHYQVAFPVLMPRNFALIINKTSAKKMQKLELTTTQIFQEFHELKHAYVTANADSSLDLGPQRDAIEKVFESLKSKAHQIDPTLEGFIGAEANKALKGLENIEKRLEKAEEAKLETGIKQIESIKEKLFPGGGLQERKENFLNFYLNDPDFIKILLTHFDPLNFSFNVLTDEG